MMDTYMMWFQLRTLSSPLEKKGVGKVVVTLLEQALERMTIFWSKSKSNWVNE